MFNYKVEEKVIKFTDKNNKVKTVIVKVKVYESQADKYIKNYRNFKSASSSQIFIPDTNILTIYK